MLQNVIFQINAVLWNFLFINESWKKNHDFHNNNKKAAQLFSTVVIVIRNGFWAPKQHIRMSFEGLCDTEDWSNGYYRPSDETLNRGPDALWS